MIAVRYITGEEPRVGDVAVVRTPVRRAHTAGDVLEIEEIGHGWVSAKGFDIPDDPNLLALIARAGDPVRFQPGDVVECVKDFDFTGAIGKGPHTVAGVSYEGWPVLLGRERDGLMRPERFRLVHRPVAPKRGDPVEPPFGAKREPLAYTSAGVGPLREGDELEATFKGRFAVVSGEGCIELPGRDGPAGKLRPQYVNLERAETVTAVEKPLAVGDRVNTPAMDWQTCEILAIDDDAAFVRATYSNGMVRRYAFPLASLERAE